MFLELLLPLLRNQLGYGVGQSPPSLRSYYNSGTSKLRFRLLNSFPFVNLLLPAIPESASPFTHCLPFCIASLPCLSACCVNYTSGTRFFGDWCLWVLRLHQRFSLIRLLESRSKQPLCSGFCLDTRGTLFQLQ